MSHDLDLMNLSIRRKLHHEVPSWVDRGETFFITVCCRPRDTNQLCHEETARHLKESIQCRHTSGEWWVRLFLLMPDHAHGLISFSPEMKMQKSIALWKRYTARYGSIQWQRDFFDHRIRGGDNLDEKAYYIRMNPVRKALCNQPDDWPYVWTFNDFENL